MKLIQPTPRTRDALLGFTYMHFWVQIWVCLPKEGPNAHADYNDPEAGQLLHFCCSSAGKNEYNNDNQTRKLICLDR